MPHENYLDLSRGHMEDAEKYLGQENWTQASEKFWGAAAAMVKAVAEARGWDHGSHRLLFRTVSRLVQEGAPPELGGRFGHAHNLHVNFYEGWLPPDQVQWSAQEVRRLVSELQPMVAPER